MISRFIGPCRSYGFSRRLIKIPGHYILVLSLLPPCARIQSGDLLSINLKCLILVFLASLFREHASWEGAKEHDIEAAKR